MYNERLRDLLSPHARRRLASTTTAVDLLLLGMTTAGHVHFGLVSRLANQCIMRMCVALHVLQMGDTETQEDDNEQ